MGYSPWAHKESDMTEQLTLLLQLTHIHFWGSGGEKHPSSSTGMYSINPLSNPPTFVWQGWSGYFSELVSAKNSHPWQTEADSHVFRTLLKCSLCPFSF